jgi:hypothetical protein
MPERGYIHLLKGDAHADFSAFEKILPVNPDNFAASYAGTLSFFFRQSFSSREIEFHVMACADRRRYRKCNKDSGFANVAASAIDKPIRFRYPNTDRPGNTAPAIPTLLN